MANYSDLVSKLFELVKSGRFDPGLAAGQRLDGALGYPTRAFPAVHVAGTNGKGSVSLKVAKALQLSGKRVGLFTSPHISCFRERIKINDVMISEEEVEAYLPQVLDEAADATFFETTTLLAFYYFAKKKVDCAVIETGLGGAKDTTNILEKPLVCAITSISLEHTRHLGDTIEEITREKAGIIKEGVPVVIGPTVPEDLVREVAVAKSAPLLRIEGDFSDYDAENSAIAAAVLRLLSVDENCIAEALKVRPACRFEERHLPNRRHPVILDVAHNPAGIKKLFQQVRERYPDAPVQVVCGFGKEKDHAACFQVISAVAERVHLVDAQNHFGMTVEAMRSYVPDAIGYATPEEAVYAALESDAVVVVCGTFMIMPGARCALGIDEPRDLFNMNERRLVTAAEPLKRAEV
ncbi:MAG: bifunctional folylpolyglutamate synthase/dihydrofolate synthase [Chlamydiales bacterium]|nr:bifunctional folylpolyglutamate synthase/dihydrofolate synthase [Chlamydiia bacterium]MCP5506697.1 bifunctional folylpolyglutamate synthase/dihydrofolate synthase [Chlamydiales bacterium]